MDIMKPFPRRWWHRPLAWLLKIVVGCYAATWRVTFSGKEEVESYLTSSNVGAIFLLWHDSLLMAPVLTFIPNLQPVHALISNSRDGDLASEFAMHCHNVHVVRVKHFARASALKESCRILQMGHSLLITPDGPRGPRREMKPGAQYAAQKSGAACFTISCTPSRFISLQTWDRFMIPLPFASINVTLSPL
jgi:lysophospholipid acyltransferase (LPLAT)-like uncharacterized protein